MVFTPMELGFIEVSLKKELAFRIRVSKNYSKDDVLSGEIKRLEKILERIEEELNQIE
jgi:hypothetical protein